jgi:hypothetical protein
LIRFNKFINWKGISIGKQFIVWCILSELLLMLKMLYETMISP